MPLSVKQLRDAEWKQSFHGTCTKGEFYVFHSDAVPGVAVVHDRPVGARKTKISYRVAGRSYDSPGALVKAFNEEERRSGQPGPGMPKCRIKT